MKKKIESTVFKDFISTSFPVRKIKYNSPGEILVEVPKALASQGSQLLNTLLLYSRKKKELELTNQLKQLEVSERRNILENQKRLEALQAVEDDLKHAVTIVENLAKLKESLKSIGTTEEEATNFVQCWLLDRLDIVFPDADKIKKIDILEN